MSWAIPNPQDSSFQFWEQSQASLWEQRVKEQQFGQKRYGSHRSSSTTWSEEAVYHQFRVPPFHPYNVRGEGALGGFLGPETVVDGSHGVRPSSFVGGHIIRDVWAWNLNAELDELLVAVESEEAKTSTGPMQRPVIALDTEFPGCLCEDPSSAARAIRYWALRENVEMLRPIQLGLAVAGRDGELKGAWTFNLWFDLNTNLYTEEAIRFLTGAGVDFPRHAIEGIDPAALAWRLARSPLVGCHCSSPRWVTFSGWYDWGYLLKLLTGRPMPHTMASFDSLLASLCPLRHELRDMLPRGSLDSLMAAHGVNRYGFAHTAGSDALATLELYLRVGVPAMKALKGEKTLELAGGRPFAQAAQKVPISATVEAPPQNEHIRTEGARARTKSGANKIKASVKPPAEMGAGGGKGGKCPTTTSAPAEAGHRDREQDAESSTDKAIPQRLVRLDGMRSETTASRRGQWLVMVWAQLAGWFASSLGRLSGGVVQLVRRRTWWESVSQTVTSVFYEVSVFHEGLLDHFLTHALDFYEVLQITKPQNLGMAITTFTFLVFICCYLVF